jgi:hypothetical protein
VSSQVFFAELRSLTAGVSIEHCVKSVVRGILDVFLEGIPVFLDRHVRTLSETDRHVTGLLVAICCDFLFLAGHWLRVSLK